MMHADHTRPIFKGKPLLYLEESIAHYAMAEGALAFLVPTVGKTTISPGSLLAELDGLILQGGADMSPLSYGETPMDERWSGDKIRDDYELTLVRECVRLNKPVLGICRGLQVMNVAFGGSLFQDIQTQVPGALVHRDWDIYDQNFHDIDLCEDTALAKLYPKIKTVKVNSVHHQGINRLGKNLQVEAVSSADGMIEAIRLKQQSASDPWFFAVQWHPEFQDRSDASLLDPIPMLREFYQAARARR
jgi:putative glutamine amidotransferase